MAFPAETSDGEKILIVESGMHGDEPIWRTEDGRRFKRDNNSGGQHKLICIDQPVEAVVVEQPLEEVTITQIGFEGVGPVIDPVLPTESDADSFTLTLEDGTVAEIETLDEGGELIELEADGGEVIEPDLDDAA